MPPTALASPAGIDWHTPLPAAVVGSGHHWWSQYQRFPVFSWRWALLRTRTWALAYAGISVLSLAAGYVFGHPDLLERWPSMLWPTALTAAPLLLAPIRHRVEDPQRAQRLLTLACAGLTLLVSAISMGVRWRTDSFALLISALTHSLLMGSAALPRVMKEVRMLDALRHDAEVREAQARQREAELQLSVLAAQVEPHFLFNTLAGIRSAIVSHPQQACDMVDHLVGYLRGTIPKLRNEGHLVSTLGTQCQLCEDYLALMHARMPRLSYAIDCPPDLRGQPCPPWMLISLVENAVKHGIEPLRGAGRIELRAMQIQPDRLQVEVIDNGAGFGQSTQGSGLGLRNIHQRLRQLFQEDAHLSLHVRSEGGVRAVLNWPMSLTGVHG